MKLKMGKCTKKMYTIIEIIQIDCEVKKGH